MQTIHIGRIGYLQSLLFRARCASWWTRACMRSAGRASAPPITWSMRRQLHAPRVQSRKSIVTAYGPAEACSYFIGHSEWVRIA
jgi:hypothetical protein